MSAAALVPVVLWISVDTLRVDAKKFMPKLSEFERTQAVEYVDAYAAATWTLPSHASMLASAPAARWRAEVLSAEPLPRAPEVLPEALAKAGWSTALVHDSKFFGPRYGLARGFSEVRETRDGARAALERLRGAGGKPLFLFVHLNSVHEYSVLEPGGKCSFKTGLAARQERNHEQHPDANSCVWLFAQYTAAVKCVDEELGLLLDGARAMPGFEKWLVLVTADHGESLCEEHFGERWHGHAWDAFDEVARVPLAVKFPGRGPGRAEERVWHLDLAPTVLAAAGLPVPKSFEGRPLLSAPRSEDEPLFVESASETSVFAGDRRWLGGHGGAAGLRPALAGFYARTPLASKRGVVTGKKGETLVLRATAAKPPRFMRPLLFHSPDEASLEGGVFRATVTFARDGDAREFAFDEADGAPLTFDSPRVKVRTEAAWPWPKASGDPEKAREALRAAGYLP